MTNHVVHIEIYYSFIMAPFYLVEDDRLLKSQLINLNQQTDLKFEVIIPDPHYSKRNWINEFSKNLKYNLKHFPYYVDTKVPKTFDYGIFNTGVLMADSPKIITFQDWRFVNCKLIETLNKYKEFEFIGFLWQIAYKDDLGKSSIHSVSTIDFSREMTKTLYDTGIFPDLDQEIYYTNNFGNKSWGHYCIDKNLWMEINGIDEVATNTRHYADLDLQARLNRLYKLKNKKINIPIVKNAMVRIMHKKGKFFGGSYMQIDREPNQQHLSCCFGRYKEKTGYFEDKEFMKKSAGDMNDKEFVEYVIEKINRGEFSKLYETPYSEEFVKNNRDNTIDSERTTIGFICNSCKVIGETPHWYRKSPEARVKSMCSIGKGDYRLGRNLLEIQNKLIDKNFENKVQIIINI